MNIELHYHITNFLNKEAMLLDARRFKEWLDLFADDIVYRMPLRVTKEVKDGSNLVDDMTFFEESKKSLTSRVERVYTKSAWAENPAPRTRHFVTNVIVSPSANDQEVNVQSWFLLLRTQNDDPKPELLFGERIDVLRNVNGEWKIASRTIHPDQTTLTVKNLSMFL